MTISELFSRFSPREDIIIAAKDGKVLYKGEPYEIKAEYGALRVFSMKFEEYEDYTPKITVFLDLPTSDWLCANYVVIERDLKSRFSVEDLARLLETDTDTVFKKIHCHLPFTLNEAKTIQRAFYPYETVEQVFSLKYTVIPAV